MTPGVTLAKAHFDSIVAGRVADFDAQLTSTFRYDFLPPVMGAGPVQVRRWRDVLFSIYRSWSYQITDSHEDAHSAVVRVNWRGSDAVEPDATAPDFFDVAVFAFTLERGRLASCSASYLEYEEHEELQPPKLKYAD